MTEKKKVTITKKKAKKKVAKKKVQPKKEAKAKTKSKAMVLSKNKSAEKVEVVKDADLDFLSPDHLRQIELVGAEIENAKLKMHVQEQQVQNIKLKLQIMNHELELAQKFANDADKTYNGKKKVRNNLLGDIKSLYKIGAEFAYDPETGRIVRD